MRIRLDIPLWLSEISVAACGKLMDNDAAVSYVCTNSREVNAGDLFIALPGKEHDGNEFAGDVRSGGGYVLGQTDASIYVDDTEAAILRLVSLYKSKLPCLKRTVAITGSVGKTTTKELTKIILSSRYKVHANLGNFNNAIGLLHTVLSAPKDTEVLITEMGMNHSGEISQLSQAVTPDVAIITNIGTAHIGNLGSREAIAKAKLEICDGMTDGVLIVPYGEALLNVGKTVSVDRGDGDYRLLIRSVSTDKSTFAFHGGNIALNEGAVALVGRHLMIALAFAISAAEVCGLSEEHIRHGTSKIDAACLRQKRIRHGRYDIYDDTYSSSPEAAIAVIKALTQQFPGNVSAVLGDMLELGEYSEELHRTVGETAAVYGVRRLYLFGKLAGYMKDGALDHGMPDSRIHVCDGIEEVANEIRRSYDGDLLIVKASHAMHAERLYDFLKD